MRTKGGGGRKEPERPLTPGDAADTVSRTDGVRVSSGGWCVKSCRSYRVGCRHFRGAGPGCASSAEDGGVVGWVESTRGVPLAGAVISVFGKTIHGNRMTLTDAQGQFVLPALPPGPTRCAP